MEDKFTIASLFSGVGGLDLGFVNAGFKLVYANDNWKGCWKTFEENHRLCIDKRSILDVKSEALPDATGIIGGPPCQSWSLAGAMRGVNDPRGKLFYEYLRILRDKRPIFFLAENVAGIVSSAHISEFNKILGEFGKAGYNVEHKLLNAKDFGVPQERKRVFVIGYRKDLNKRFDFSALKKSRQASLKEAIGDLPESLPAIGKNKPNSSVKAPNQEHITGGFSTIFLSRNRRRSWDKPSFTIQAGGRHAPLHPSSSEMIKLGPDRWGFKGGEAGKTRRLSVRECARIQTFPDDFIFYYDTVDKGYTMIGNAVPVKLAEAIARQIKEDLAENLEAK